jgi:release factor glutamine methyltransferase
MSPPQKTHASVKNTVQAATARLQAALKLERQDARLEAQILTAHALATHRAWLVAHDQDVLTPAQAHAVEALVARREQGEPVAYILGEKEFYGRLFKVTPDVLIPRPETELLVEAALEQLSKDRPAQILDMGTGSGCIAISLALARPDCIVTAVDASAAALAVAITNADRLLARVEFLSSNWFFGLHGRQFDIIVSNPPYVARDDMHLSLRDLPYEPLTALASGADGLDDIRVIAASSGLHLKPQGHLLLEHGWEQSDAVRALLTSAGFMKTMAKTDLAGLPRIVIGGEFSSVLRSSDATFKR